MKDTEAEIKRKFNEWYRVRIRKGVFKNTKLVPYSPFPYGEAGTPDKVGCVCGQMVVIEFKTKGKKLSPHQVVRKAEWLDAGAVYIQGDNIDDLRKEFLKIYKEANDAKEKCACEKAGK